MNWPSYIQKSRPITESMVFIVSDSLVDLNFLQGTTGRPVRSGTCSELERLADVISTGEGRDIEAAVASAPVRYSTSVVKFTLEPPPRVPASSVPAPEDTREWKRLEGVESPKDLQSMMTAMSLYDADLATEKSIFGHARRVAQKIPPCVWVVNQHTEVIKVAVSQFGSYRKVTDVGVDASATGVGFNLSLAVFDHDATIKVLRQNQKAKFRLLTRRDGFGVISIYTGPDSELYIEKDHIPLGVTAYFVNEPELKVMGIDGTWLEDY